MRLRKYLFMMVVAIFVSSYSFAQTEQGEKVIGVNLSGGFGDGYSNFGIGAKIQYNVLDNFRVEPAFNYFFKNDYVSMWDLSANFHYLFGLTDKFTLYPLAGIGVASAKAHLGDFADDLYDDDYGFGNETTTKFAFNLGAGAEYMVTDRVSLNLEYKYKFCSDLNRSHITLGVGYHF